MQRFLVSTVMPEVREDDMHWAPWLKRDQSVISGFEGPGPPRVSLLMQPPINRLDLTNLY